MKQEQNTKQNLQDRVDAFVQATVVLGIWCWCLFAFFWQLGDVV